MERRAIFIIAVPAALAAVIVLTPLLAYALGGPVLLPPLVEAEQTNKPDPNWFYSSLAQSAAALVGLMGGVLVTNLIGLRQLLQNPWDALEGV